MFVDNERPLASCERDNVARGAREVREGAARGRTGGEPGEDRGRGRARGVHVLVVLPSALMRRRGDAALAIAVNAILRRPARIAAASRVVGCSAVIHRRGGYRGTESAALLHGGSSNRAETVPST